ncbi:hypothetical protein [Spirulina sp. 06S082]|nr:hypothetical protein [Spirulina sp. 06S082]MEA5470034.1 hypothetical protein [Spirulina sp. 06S082]
MEISTRMPLISILFLVAVLLLGVISIGILYLSVLEWRDRRRASDDKRIN